MAIPQIQRTPRKEEFAKLTCLFLAEQMRIKTISLERASEIAQKVVANLNLLDTEQDFLKFIKELTSDFEELVHLEQRVFMHAEVNERRQMENQVKDFVISVLTHDANLALNIMEAAIKDGTKLEHLSQSFPEFKNYMEKTSHDPRRI